MHSDFPTNHTFAVCAYKESEYLNDCILSLLNQTVKTNVVVCTSTPNEYIQKITDKYNIKLFVREGSSDIQDDWNFAINKIDTDWVTVAHQDDLYNPHYAEEILKTIELNPDGIMAFTDYRPIHGDKISDDKNCKIKRILRSPMKLKCLSYSKFFKKYILSLGNSICCPSVTYSRKKIDGDIFTSDLRFSLDWDTYVKLSSLKGRFLYINKPLTYYRVHKGATTTAFIENHRREAEDYYMFQQFWPKPICKLIMHFYKKSYKNYVFDKE